MRAKRTLLGLCLAAGLGLSGCATVLEGQQPGRVAWTPASADPAVPMGERRADNRAVRVASHFPETPTVLRDETGLGTSELFFEYSDTVVVAGPSDAAQLRGASIAVFTHAPMLSYSPDRHEEIIQELYRLGASRVLKVGQVDMATSTGAMTVMADPGTRGGLGDLTAHEFYQVVVNGPEEMAEAVASLDGSTPVLLSPAWDALTLRPARMEAFPIASRRDAQLAPVTVATPTSPLVAVANARSYGAEVRVVDQPDPRESEQALAAMIGLANRPLVALGEQFGSSRQLAGAIAEAEQAALD